MNEKLHDLGCLACPVTNRFWVDLHQFTSLILMLYSGGKVSLMLSTVGNSTIWVLYNK